MSLFKKKKKESIKNDESIDQELLSKNLDESIIHLTIEIIKVLQNRMNGEHNGKADSSYYNTGQDLIRIFRPHESLDIWEITLFEEEIKVTIIPLHEEVKTKFNFRSFKPFTRISGQKTECYLLYKTVEKYTDYLQVINIKKISSLLKEL